MYDKIYSIVQQIKEKRPLILNLTNDVTMDFIANGLLSLGASPLMSTSSNEMDDLLHLANAVVINLGTLNEQFITRCKHACDLANQLGKPLILDPVGAGASRYRTETCLQLLAEHRFTMLRGNASEVMALCKAQHSTKGVDSHNLTADAIEPAKRLSTDKQITIVISGATDAIINQTNVELCMRGSPLMPSITGTGCLLTAILSAFHSVHHDKNEAACAAVIFYGVCGEKAAKRAQGPGSFKVHFLDELAQHPNREDYEH